MIKKLKLGPESDMAYKKKTYKLRAGIEVEEYHSAKYGAPGQERRPKKKLTPEQMKSKILPTGKKR